VAPDEPYEQPRALTEREREILDFLLSVDLPGIVELREQAKTALAVRWAEWDASFSLYVDREATRPAPLRTRPLIEAYSKRRDFEHMYDLLLWVDKEGWLSSVEGYPVGDVWPEELLPPSEFDPPEPHNPENAIRAPDLG
jgi:hypothetical protein